jgi:hypothetical protein
MENEKRPPRWPAAEPILPTETERLPAALWRTAPISEPERPTRWVWIVLGVAVLFALAAGGGYYWLGKQGQAPTAEVNPLPNAAVKAAPTAAQAPTIPPAPQLAVGLRSLSSQQRPDEPATAQSPPSEPSQPPTYGVGLRPITEQTSPNAPAPAAEAPPPAEPLPAPLLQPRPARKAAPPPSVAPGGPPSQSSGSVKF